MNLGLDQYTAFVEEKGLIFQYPFYLDIVSSGNWAFQCIAPDKKDIKAIFPYYYENSNFGLRIKNKGLLKYAGPWVDPEVIKNSRPSTVSQYIEDIINSLPTFASLNLLLHPEALEPLVFRHHGFSQGVMYTYMLDVSDLDKLKSGFNQNIKRNLKKNKDKINVEEITDFDVFYSLVKNTVARRNTSMFIDYSTVEKLCKICIEKDKGTLLIAHNSEDEPVAGMFLVWDRFYMHYLVGGFHPDWGGAMASVFFEAFKLANEKGVIFDFHGSMDKDIGNYFRSFGAGLTPYYTLTKYNSKALFLIDKLSSRLG